MLKINVENLDGIDASFHSLYTEQADGTFLLTGVEGMKTQADVDRIHTALTKERSQTRALRAELAPFQSHGTTEEILGFLDRREELEAAAAGGGDKGKIDAIVEGRIKSRLAPLERERDTLKGRLGELEGEVNTYKTRENERVIGDAIRSAAGKTKGFNPVAMEDALLAGSRALTLDEDGRVVTKDGLDADSWMLDLQAKKPHWWLGSVGGGAGGANGGGGAEPNPYTHEHWNLTEQGKLLKADPAKADRLAKAAGHEKAIGARRPDPKK
ncbi:scaffolding protein [Stenotrophomonas phage Siara]|uniref:Scaffolding protein n=1 Tax=Stenotrophomonas phage Siara TaxID=2859658 RepID=A0AAE8BI90_9CAUD|nr:scaffolding protein [Stenotrophomonas phage Siara]QYW02037.1 scaffolding protein [Stenotrophomonas phage Siara]